MDFKKLISLALAKTTMLGLVIISSGVAQIIAGDVSAGTQLIATGLVTIFLRGNLPPATPPNPATGQKE